MNKRKKTAFIFLILSIIFWTIITFGGAVSIIIGGESSDWFIGITPCSGVLTILSIVMTILLKKKINNNGKITIPFAIFTLLSNIVSGIL